MYSADLKKVLKDRGLLTSLKSLAEVDRIFLNLKQQTKKVASTEAETQKGISKIFALCDELVEQYVQSELLLRDKLKSMEEWERHCQGRRQEYGRMKEEFDEKASREAKRAEELEQENIAREKLKQLREWERRETDRTRIKSWQEGLEQEHERENLMREMVEFERRQKFRERLPILQEAAARREELRKRKLEERDAQKLARQEEERKREETLERLRALVRVEAIADPTRVVKDTKAWRNRREEDEPSTRFFSLQSFTDKQVTPFR